ncbi:DUF1501 domain-containing protein [Anatilimnocola sp. NA78]|uniref:DUF1501 domain-containing protein n=1 Tax=Anatilimnocola sp. NA78 TaxID=3415683 RepID=UPI003CE57C86
MPAKITAAHHPQISRRTVIQAGSIGLLGLGMNHLAALRAADNAGKVKPAKSVIYIFLSGGLSQQDSFDPKPAAPENVRGDFKPIATKTPGVQVCEHLPLLAARSNKWALVRSLTHPYNEHSQGHHVMLTGRSPMPVGFNPSKPLPSDWPSMAAIAGDALRPQNNLPPAVVLPERLIHRTGRVIPGQFAGLMGPKREPWFISASPFNGKTYGAYPEYEFHHETGKADSKLSFQAPNLALPEGLSQESFANRQHLRKLLDGQRGELEQAAGVQQFDRFRQSAISLLSEPSTQAAFDVTRASEKLQDAYGRNSFGRSLLMARQLVEAGVSLVQVNLGNNEAWDNHQSIFPNLKNFLLPPTDQAVSALLDDLSERGLLDETLVVMAGEFGRTPRVFGLSATRLPGRDHWGAVQTVFFAGGGVKGGAVVGSSDRIGGYPHNDPQTPEQMAATIYSALGIPAVASWRDESDRPHHIYQADPIVGLMA